MGAVSDAGRTIYRFGASSAGLLITAFISVHDSIAHPNVCYRAYPELLDIAYVYPTTSPTHQRSETPPCRVIRNRESRILLRTSR